MFSRIWLINLVLTGFVVFFGIKALGVWSEGEQPASQSQAVERPTAVSKKKGATKRRIPRERAYEAVVDKNLFTPERAELKPEGSEPGSKVTPKDKKPRISGREIVLYGVIITDDYKSAVISNPNPGPGEGASKCVKVGDKIGDFKVAEIKEEKIVLAEGSKEYEILLYNKEKPKKRGTVKKSKERPPAAAAKSKDKKRPEVIDEAKKKRPTWPFGVKRGEEKDSKSKHDIMKSFLEKGRLKRND